MKQSTITHIAQALASAASSGGSLSARELQERTGLSRSSIDKAIRELNFNRTTDRPYRYSAPTEGLQRKFKNKKPLPTAPVWHRPLTRKTWDVPTKVVWDDSRYRIGTNITNLEFGYSPEEIHDWVSEMMSLCSAYMSLVDEVDKALNEPDWAERLGVVMPEVEESE